MNKLTPTEYKGQRILTTNQLAEYYNVSADQIKKNYNRNKSKYIEGRHFFFLEGEELRTFKREVPNCPLAENINRLYLWTEHGALLHAKSLGTNEAWATYGKLVDTYFQARKLHEAIESGEVEIKIVAPQLTIDEKLFGRANSAVRNMRTAFKEAGVDPQQTVITMQQIYKQVGIMIPLGGMVAPEKTYDKTAIAKRIGIFSETDNPHAHAVGAIIAKIDVSEDEKTLVPYNRNGHPGKDYQYSESVINKVADWLKENNYPERIQGASSGYNVKYQSK